MPRTQAEPERDIHAEAEEIIGTLREAIAAGDVHWFLALMEAVRGWPLPAEMVAERSYRYLVGGEAFDWLLLAERLLSEVSELVPAEETDALLFNAHLPLDTTDAELQKLLGAKYKPHLNFVYGIRVEEALHEAVSDEVRKERTAAHFENGNTDDEVFHRIYFRPMAELLAEFREESGLLDAEWMSLAELSEWRYWLFQYRVRCCDPAKVASDTRKGLGFIQRLELARRSMTAPE